ncbi:hypothetical protein L3X38_011031 [Prunus dulcis]|uniref:Uncharacterized protein n=1 Tax=Prunus dulcis TaxID=3755 RepID=A0AAD4WGS1_PRUDU|nr:hypothetical protein L3X38_011031 [Prunus dulcis]
MAVPGVDILQKAKPDTGGCVSARGHNTKEPGYSKQHDGHDARVSQQAVQERPRGCYCQNSKPIYDGPAARSPFWTSTRTGMVITRESSHHTNS